MNHLLKLALAAGTATLLAGGAMAQQSPGSPGGGTGAEPPSQTSPMERSPGGATSPGGAEQQSPSGSAMAPSEEWVGKDVVNAQGETIGEVEAVSGDSAIISVGGFLGIGAKQVELSGDQISATGSGEDMKLTTNLSKEELEALPSYKAPGESGSGGSMTPGGTTTPGGGGTR